MRKCTAVYRLMVYAYSAKVQINIEASASSDCVFAYLRDERYESLFDTLGVDAKAVQLGRARAVAGERQTMASRGIIGRGHGGGG